MDKLQWGNRKRLRCMKVKGSPLNGKSDGGGGGFGGGVVKKKMTSRVVDNNTNNSSNGNNSGRDGHVLPPVPSPHRPNRTFLHNLSSQCPFTEPFSFSPIRVDGESFEKAMSSSSTKNEYTAVLFYASSCPFSSIFHSKFSTLSSMYPQIKHIMVEQSSVMPSVLSRYGIHSVPSLLIVNQKARTKYHGRKDLQSLVNFYRSTTGMDPMVGIVEDASNNPESGQNASFKEIFLNEPYLILSVLFVTLRALLYIYPEIASRLLALWAAYVPHLNLGIFGESRQVLAHVLHLIDLERIWSKMKICKTRNFHEGARNARVWASSLASVSLGETSSSRVYPSRDFSN